MSKYKIPENLEANFNKLTPLEQDFCGIRKGVVFYFFQNPDKRIIQELIEDFVAIANPKYTHFRQSDSVIKPLKIDWKEFFSKTLEKQDFENSLLLLLTDAGKNKLQNNSIQLLLQNINNNFPVKIPNMIYFEFENRILWEDIHRFICRACYSLTYHYISAGYNIATNPHLFPRSGSEGMKLLRLFAYTNSLESTWWNYSFMQKIEKAIDGPNIIQVLNNTMFEKIGYDAFSKAKSDKILDYELGEDYIVLNLFKLFKTDKENDVVLEDFFSEIFCKLKTLNRFLNPITVNFKNPTMFWKANQWDVWQNRFKL